MGWAIFDKTHMAAIQEIVDSKSERIVAIVGGAYLDETLHRTLKVRLRDEDKIADKLLKVGRPLGNLEPKIDLLYMLGAFEKTERNALYGLCVIRNLFAHHLDMSFDSQNPKMVEQIDKLTLHEGRKLYPHHIYDKDSNIAVEATSTKRDVFIVNLKICLNFLMKDRMRHWPNTNTAYSEKEFEENIKKNFPGGVAP